MREERCATEVVLALVRVINGEQPRMAAAQLLDPEVEIRMDSSVHRGIDIWYKWIHLIRNCGLVSGLRMTDCQARPDPRDPELVNLTARWSGIQRASGASTVSTRSIELRYLVRDGYIRKIWTRKTNYEFVFGPWIAYAVCYRLFLGWALLYFALLSVRRRNILADYPELVR